MIDGYTVPEAASVLGVPEGRVWELLARGVISGSPDGDSMRVHLKARTEPMVASHEPAPKSNGNGGSNGGSEASAFRELLTEFRNLTERYGQALLALGEARGEVAGLRSRVELLESRLDLRLPGQAGPPPVAWAAPEMPQPEPVPAPPPAAVAVDREEPVRAPRPRKAPARKPKAETQPRRAHSRRSAVAGIAEALARAEDPSVAELPQSAAQREAPDREPAPAPVAEPIATPAETTYSTEVVEPDWFADGDFAWLDAAEHVEPAMPGEPASPAEEPSVAVDLAEAETELAEAEAEVVAEEMAMAELESAPGAYAEPVAALEAVEPAELDAPAEPDEPAEAVESAKPDEPAEPAEPAAPVLTLTEEELAQLAADEGWGASEVEAIRSLIGSEPTTAPISLPGAAELDDAMAALEATPREEPWSNAWPEAEPISIRVEPAREVEPAPPPAQPVVQQLAPPAFPRPTSNEPAWLRRRRGPAASAFRTLRRLFPG